MPDSKAETPPVIRRAEVVAFALVALLIICVVAVLYVAKAFFLPITMAFIIGTMLSPAASLMERYRIPRAVAAVLIVIAVGAAVTFMFGLIASPVMEWSNNLPELGARLKDKAHLFDRPLALWQELQACSAAPIRWRHSRCRNSNGCSRRWNSCRRPSPNSCCLSPTLILFIASWRELRRAMIMNFGDHPARLRTMRILNEIEEHLGNYLLMVTMINIGVGIVTGIICVVDGNAQSGRPRRDGRDLELHSDHRTDRDVCDPGRGRPRHLSDPRRRPARAAGLCRR